MSPGSFRTYHCNKKWLSCTNTFSVHSAEEDPDEYPFPLTLRTKQPTVTDALSPAAPAALQDNN